MNLQQHITFLFVLFVTSIFVPKTHACSMYKITVNGKTMTGCNEDAWRTSSRIVFKNPSANQKYGVCYTGSRIVSKNRVVPQSGMNTVGLSYSRLQSYYPKQDIEKQGLKTVGDEVVFLTDILQSCKTVKEVQTFYEKYDHSVFIDDVFIYVDAQGNYLVVEPYGFVSGNEAEYVLSNFCPSITDNDTKRQLVRYSAGEDYLKKHPAETNLSYCQNLSDTMHVCRSRNGDGTLLTSIWNAAEGEVNLFFYHSFDSTIQFSIKDELAKGDHELVISELFPENAEFVRLQNYRTPFNTAGIRVSMVLLAGILVLLTGLLFFTQIRSNTSGFSLPYLSFMAILNVLLVWYLFVLATHKYIYYFDAPYEHYGSWVITVSSYLPFVFLLAAFPFLMNVWRKFKLEDSSNGTKIILALNSLILVGLIGSFAYWGLYSIWG